MAYYKKLLIKTVNIYTYEPKTLNHPEIFLPQLTSLFEMRRNSAFNTSLSLYIFKGKFFNFITYQHRTFQYAKVAPVSSISSQYL